MPPGTGKGVFEQGEHQVKLLNVEVAGGDHPPSPKPLLVAAPADGNGDFPVLVLLHGYLLRNSFYSQLMRHVSSHGFVVVAPQLYSIAGPDSTDEIRSAAATLQWLPAGLSGHLPPGVKPDLSKVALAGHSRGGKAAFAVALGLCGAASPALKISAVIGIDPVDGRGAGRQTDPPVLTHNPRSFDIGGAAALVIGSGLGEERRNPLFPPCAPAGVNHRDFFAECRSPCWHLVAEGYGHLDMLDDETAGIRGRATYCLCKNGEARGPMRRFVGGAVVAFLRRYLGGEEEDDGSSLSAIRDGGLGELPVALSVVDSR